MTSLRAALAAFLLCLGALPGAANPYASAGAPPPDRPWQTADCQLFAKLVRERTVPLPLLKDEAGGPLLRQFCNVQNLAFLRDKALPMSARMKDYMTMNLAIGGLFKVYLEKTKGGEPHEDELTVLGLYALEAWAVGAELADEGLAAIPEGQKSPVRRKAAEWIRASAAAHFRSLVTSVVKDRRSSENQTRLLEGLAAVAPRFAKLLNLGEPEVRGPLLELRGRSSGKDRAAIDSMLNPYEAAR